MTKILVFVLLFYSVYCLFEGDPCKINKTGVNGKCETLLNCKWAQDELRYRRISPQLCGFSGQSTIVCCAIKDEPATTEPIFHRYDSKITPGIDDFDRVTPVRTTPPPTKNRFDNDEQDECIFPANAFTVKRDESPYKAWNKCIDLADSVFPCTSPGFNLNAAKIRVDMCQHSASELILGGVAAKTNEFPHVAVLGYENPETSAIAWDCGGTLISEEWVMSAAHCLYHRNLRANVSLVRLGGGDLRVPAEAKFLFTIIEKVTHPDYQGAKIYNDITLLKLDRAVRYSKIIRPACLHVGNNIKDNKALAIGYGMMEDNQKSNILQKVVLHKFTYEECAPKNPPKRRSPDGIRNATQLCYGSHSEVKDTCQGDSGGSLQIYNQGVHCTYVVIGITSAGQKCGIIGQPAIYTRVSAYVPWIESVIWPN